MEARLVPLNALLALTLGQGGWPALLGQAGFRVHLIEGPVQTDAGPIVADLILVREAPPLIVLCEGKSGANVDDEQVRRYSTASWLSLQRAGSDPPALRGVPGVELVVLMAVLQEHRARIERGLEKLELTLPVLSIAREGRVTLTAGEALGLADDVCDVPGLPPALVPVDRHSPVEELLDPVRAEIVAAMSRDDRALDLDALCQVVFAQWAAVAKGARGPLKKRVLEACRALERDALEDGIRVETGGGFEPRVAILRTPEQFDLRGRTQGYQRLQRQSAKATGRRMLRAPEGQLSLDDLATEGGLGDD